MKVVIVDDMLLLREGLARILHDRGVDVVAEAATADGLIDLVSRTQPDAVILDIRMPLRSPTKDWSPQPLSVMRIRVSQFSCYRSFSTRRTPSGSSMRHPNALGTCWRTA